MSNWFHHFFNPHCPHCVDEKRESKICPGCEVLKQQLESVSYDNKRLMDRLLEKPIVEVAKPLVEMTKPTNIPWNVRRQMLEAEDREKARLMRSAPQPISTDNLEKELDIATDSREKENAS